MVRVYGSTASTVEHSVAASRRNRKMICTVASPEVGPYFNLVDEMVRKTK